MRNVTVMQLKQRLDAGEAPLILDVREPDEYQAGSLPESVHIPLGQLPVEIHQLEEKRDDEIVVHCRSGVRSLQAAALMEQMGFTNVANLEGGVKAWKAEVDPSFVVG